MAASPELDASSSTAAPTDSASAADQAKKTPGIEQGGAPVH